MMGRDHQEPRPEKTERGFLLRVDDRPGSCSHGAGRRMSRAQAKRTFTLADHEAATAGVECRKDAGVIDETPGAYKEWTNIVSCCLACNSRKANSLPNFSGRKRSTERGQMRPLREPRRPTRAELLRAGLEFIPADVRETWADALYWGVELRP